jgi:hypothetical protein
VSSISVTNDIATVKLKNGKIEKYNLDNDEELANFEKKYGKMPAPPAPPPAPAAEPPQVLPPQAPRPKERMTM